MATCMRVWMFLFFLMGAADFSCSPAQAGKLIDAVKLRDLAQVRRLLEAGESLREKVKGDYPLNVAALFGPPEMVAVLLEAGADIEQPGRDGLHPLHNAVLSDRIDVVVFLIAQGAAVNSRDSQGRTPLLSFAAIVGKNLDIPRALLASGADPMLEESVDQLRPLDFAAISGEVELAELLLSSGADINARQTVGWGETALMHAVFHNQIEFVRLLVAQGADVSLANKQGQGILFYAEGKPEIHKILVAAGAK